MKNPALSINNLLFNGDKSSISLESTITLREAANKEVYELSTVNDSGVYLPPSPSNEKHDHWLVIDQEAMAFRLPSPRHLTTQSGEKHCFFTPSTTVH
ncbi:hypothetical protein BDF14DRAFT_1722427 [Spinellus fusiger]|nr:hypothetical protein BDF14DRAFT_1722427 [Spinellus fusiger]